MDERPAGIPAAADPVFDAAVEAADQWRRAHSPVTGMWLDRRHRSIGVGIRDGDEVETTESLRALVSSAISIRTRIASPRMVELWQLQADVGSYLEEEHIWGRWAVALSVEPQTNILEIGLLSGTPDDVISRIRARFPNDPLCIVTGTTVIALQDRGSVRQNGAFRGLRDGSLSMPCSLGRPFDCPAFTPVSTRGEPAASKGSVLEPMRERETDPATTRRTRRSSPDEGHTPDVNAANTGMSRTT